MIRKKRLIPRICFGLGMTIALFFFVGIYQPSQTNLKNMREKIVSLEKEWAVEKKNKENLKLKMNETKNSASVPQHLLSELPTFIDIPGLLSKWTEKSKKMGINVLLFESSEDKLFSGVAETIIRVKVEGAFHQTLQFLEFLSSTEKKILISNIEMSKPEFKQGEYVISTVALVSVFQRKENKP